MNDIEAGLVKRRSLKSIHDLLTNVYSDNVLSTIRGDIESYSGIQHREKKYELKRGEIVLGFRDRDYETEPVTIEITTRTCILIGSDLAGSGKTVLGGNLVEQIRHQLKASLVLFDSKAPPEFSYRRRPQSDPKWIRKLNMIRQQIPYVEPKGWGNMVSVKPEFLRNELYSYGKENYIRYDSKDMDFEDLKTLLDLREDRQTDIESINKLKQVAYEDKGRKRIASSDVILEHYREKVVKDARMQYRIDNMIADKVVGETSGINIIDLLNEGKMVHYETETTKDKHKSSKIAYMSMAIKQISEAREASLRNSHTEQRLDMPVFLYITEFPTVYPSGIHNPSTKPVISRVYDQLRFQDISIIGDTPDLKGIDSTALTQSDYIICFRMTGEQLHYLTKEKNLWEYHDLISNLYFNKKKPPQQAVLIRSESGEGQEKVETFYPLPPMSKVQVTTTY
jgi:hypothetical protein